MIFCVGSINVDFIFAAGRWPVEHEKYRVENYACASGGSAANTAVELSRLGRNVTVVGGIGTDDSARSLSAASSGQGSTSITLSGELIGRPDAPPFVQWEIAKVY
jgi:ribokinase